jgi:hypothetical protein
MSTAFTPFIAEGRTAQLDLGVHGCSDCRIAGFAGADVFLDVREGLLPGGEERPAYLLLEDGDKLRAMRGRVEAGRTAGTAVLRVTDPFTGQRRLFSRAPLAVRTHVRSLVADATEWDTFTRDVSAGGVSLARRAEWDGAMTCELTLAPAEAVRIVVEAEVVRIEEHALGMRFTAIEPSGRLLMAELALAFHRAG